jgi:acyl-CoA synthetase (AMP-forming)/AMP-acid ligase II
LEDPILFAEARQLLALGSRQTGAPFRAIRLRLFDPLAQGGRDQVELAGHRGHALPSSRTKRTACCLNSSVNRRRARRLCVSAIADIVSTFRKMSTKPDQAHRNGWHHTGDLGYLDTDGYLYVVGRLKDNIITGGFKVSAVEVEEVILEVPTVDECAVVAVMHPVRGEAVAAIVTARPGRTLLIADIRRHCKERLGAVKAPRYVHCWSQLPKTAVGKIDKRRIRQRLEAGE